MLLADEPQRRLNLVQPGGATSRHALGIGEIKEILVPSPAPEDFSLAFDRQQRMAHDIVRRVEDGRWVDEGPVEIRQELSVLTVGATTQPRSPPQAPCRVWSFYPLAGWLMKDIR